MESKVMEIAPDVYRISTCMGLLFAAIAARLFWIWLE